MKILIRPTKLTDIAQMMTLNQNSLPENYDKEFWMQKFHVCKSHSFVALVSGDIIGYIFADNDSIISFAVDSKYRGKGIGKQLLHHCLNTFTNSVKLHVRVSNEPALKLYSLLGFKETETIKNYYVSPVEDSYVMEWKPTAIKYEEKKKFNTR